MEEKTIIKGKFFKFFWVILAAVAAIVLFVWFAIVPEVAGTNSTEFDVCSVLCPVLIILTIVLFFYVNGCEITVTDKRVYGKAAFGKRVDLPLDSISSVASKAFLKRIFVATSSGKVAFCLATNYAELHAAINELLIARQKKSPEPRAESSSDELKKLKELLDTNVITQEEFEAKKKQILGL